MQEALTNVARHAVAENVAVRIDQSDDGIRVSVRDDGRGFSESQTGKTLGLLGMRERIMTLGGKLEIESAADQGTSVEATHSERMN